MRLISTLCNNRAEAMRILREVPHHSIVLIPETIEILGKTLVPISKQKDLFIIYNQNIKIDDKWHIAFHGINRGEYKFRVRKFNLWNSDIESGYEPSEPEPFISVRNHPASLFICYDAVEIFKMSHMLRQEKIEYLLIAANWQFNFPLIDRIADFSLQQIPSLKAVCFSCTNTIAFVKTQNQEKRISKTGYVELLV